MIGRAFKMEDKTFYALAFTINKLVTDYQSGALKHHQYVGAYDKTLEQYRISKRQWVAEINRRSLAKQQAT